jgi:hypothetical protein
MLVYKQEAQKDTIVATIDLKIKYLEKKKQEPPFFKTLDALCELLLLDKGHASLDTDRHNLAIVVGRDSSVTKTPDET